MLTLPHATFTPFPHPECTWLRGQLESGAESGYLHWQVLVAFRSKKSLPQVSLLFPRCHAELSRSEAAADYVWKEETRVPNTQFEFGAKPIQRNSKIDWETVWECATKGDIMAVPPTIRVQSYRTLKLIAADHAEPIAMERTCDVFWGRTGTGKSRKAWNDAGPSVYAKDPRTKWWCGYRGQTSVIIDEFRGTIDVSHLLRWLDRYPVSIETKGSSCPLLATKFFITSNMDPRQWYPELDAETYSALLRRLNITHFP